MNMMQQPIALSLLYFTHHSSQIKISEIYRKIKKKIFGLNGNSLNGSIFLGGVSKSEEKMYYKIDGTKRAYIAYAGE